MNVESSYNFDLKTGDIKEIHILDENTDKIIANNLISTTFLLEKCKLDKLICLVFNKIQHIVKNNLTGNKPKLILFNIYKLLYFGTL